MYPDLCGTAGELDDTGGGTAAEDVPADDTGGRGVDDPPPLADAGLPAPLPGRVGPVAEGFPGEPEADELTTGVTETTDVMLIPDVEAAPDEPCVAPTAAFADELLCDSGYATAIATTTTAPTAASTTARRRPGCDGGAGAGSGSRLSGMSEPRTVNESCGTTRPVGSSSSGSSSTPALKESSGMA